MLGVYIHIPFCAQKCSYCSFFVIAQNRTQGYQNLIDLRWKGMSVYLDSIRSSFSHTPISTLYIGGGTPLMLGVDGLSQLLDALEKTFDMSECEELTIELNPNPLSQMEDLLRALQPYCTRFKRIRLSIGIQSLSDRLLADVGRQYTFQDFQALTELISRYPQYVYNMDLIAFGVGENRFVEEHKRSFFEETLQKKVFHSVSLYALEVTPGSDRSVAQKRKGRKSDDTQIITQHHDIKSVLLKYEYIRYELSNFALPGYESKHNQQYRSGGSYLGLGPGAVSFLSQEILNSCPEFAGLWNTHLSENDIGVRRMHHLDLRRFGAGELHAQQLETLGGEDRLIEQFFLSLRTRTGIANLHVYESLLVHDWQKRIEQFLCLGLIDRNGEQLSLTDAGLDVYNEIVVQLLEKI